MILCNSKHRHSVQDGKYILYALWFFHQNVWIIMSNCVGVRLILFFSEAAGTTDETNCLCNYAGGGWNGSLYRAKVVKLLESVIQPKQIIRRISSMTANKCIKFLLI